jgi:hypothetical protein
MTTAPTGFRFSLAHHFFCAAILAHPSSDIFLRFQVGLSCSLGGNPRFNGAV